ncbi:hypothetical protein JHW43_001266 [Diplocarpon mali]|nr:hypothetical protein JHW43_001266 [Diplocarpon mali]
MAPPPSRPRAIPPALLCPPSGHHGEVSGRTAARGGKRTCMCRPPRRRLPLPPTPVCTPVHPRSQHAPPADPFLRARQTEGDGRRRDIDARGEERRGGGGAWRAQDRKPDPDLQAGRADGTTDDRLLLHEAESDAPPPCREMDGGPPPQRLPPRLLPGMRASSCAVFQSCAITRAGMRRTRAWGAGSESWSASREEGSGGCAVMGVWPARLDGLLLLDGRVSAQSCLQMRERDRRCCAIGPGGHFCTAHEVSYLRDLYTLEI